LKSIRLIPIPKKGIKKGKAKHKEGREKGA